MIIDGTNLIAGRVATRAAKLALLGEKVDIVNCDKLVITGNKKNIIERFTQKIHRGTPHHGPFYPKTSDRIMRRMIRDMLPYKKERGIKAFKRVMCYVGIPDKFKNEKMETIKEANVSKLPNIKFMTFGELTKYIGGKR